MSENMPQTGTGVERLRLWRERFRETLAPSPLEDAEQLAARLDLTHAHPSGIAKLFASGQVSLDSLFRDNGMLRAAGRRIERVLDDRAAKSRVSGMAELSLVVGIATWSGRQMPVLLYPVDVERRGDSVTTGTTIRFTGRVHLNSAFVNEMRNGGVELDERDLFDGSHYATGSPETSTVFSAITNLATQVFGDFAIERHIVIGCFFDPSTQMLLASASSTHWPRARRATHCWMRWPGTGAPRMRYAMMRSPSSARSMATRTRNSRPGMWIIRRATRPRWPRAGIRWCWIARPA